MCESKKYPKIDNAAKLMLTQLFIVQYSITYIQQEAELMLTNLRDAFIGQSRSSSIVPFHMLGIVSYCAILTLSLKCAVFTILDFKNVVTLK